jgi:cytochrome c oxidase subunit 1
VADPEPWNLEGTDQFSREWQWFERRLAAERGTGEDAESTGEPRRIDDGLRQVPETLSLRVQRQSDRV